jgi:hypothetical protein
LGDDDVEDPLGPSRWSEPDAADYLASLRQLHGLDEGA